MRAVWRQLTRREIYRQLKRHLLRCTHRRWQGTLAALQHALRRLLRPLTRIELLRLARRPAAAIALILAAQAAPSGYTDIIELSEISADDNGGGFLISGIDTFSFLGDGIAGGGDINGDGLDDLIVSANLTNYNGSLAGVSYVIFGKATGTSVDLTKIKDGIGGFGIYGASASDLSGRGVSLGGDINLDGLDDIIVGAPGAGTNGENSGTTYVVWGKANNNPVYLADVESGIGGFAIHGISETDRSGEAVSATGDINGDGRADILIGAYRAGTTGAEPGAAYVVFGKSSGTAVQLSDIAQDGNPGGFALFGTNNGDRAGVSVSIVGDMNGDGKDDFIVGASYADSTAGISYVVFGKDTGTSLQLSDIAQDDNNAGFAIFADADGVRSGSSVSGAGDVNGDGRADVIVGAKFGGFESGGISYVVFGKSTGTVVQTTDLALDNNTVGFAINEATNIDQSGFSVSGGGDINTDGRDDLIVGAPLADNNAHYAGTTFVVYGKASGTKFDLATLENNVNSEFGLAIFGIEENDKSGSRVAHAGDINGDGNDDILIGASGVNTVGNFSGAAYVVFSPLARTAVWLDFAHTGTENGRFGAPYNTLNEAISNVPEEGTIKIKAYNGIDTTTGNFTITKPLTIEAIGGTITIGAQ